MTTPVIGRVEMLLPAMPAAGMETVVAVLCRGLAARGVDVGITCLIEEGAMAASLRAEGIRVSVVPTPGFLPNLIAGRPLRKWLRDRRPDVAHAHSGVWLKAARAARAAGVKRIIYTAHGLLDPMPKCNLFLMREAARLTHRIVGVSDSVSDYHVTNAHPRRGQVVTVLNGVDTRRFHPGPGSGVLRAAFGIDEGAPLVGIVARLEPVKNHAMLIDAFALVHLRHPDAVLALVGDGLLRSDLTAQVIGLGLERVVRFAGAMSDMPPIYRDIDIFVLSSVAEGTSISILEAMASARCIVGTAVGGTPMLLDQGRAGVLVPPSDPRALADALIRLLADRAGRAELAAAARMRAENVFSERTMVDRYLELYGLAGAPAAGKESAACVE